MGVQTTTSSLRERNEAKRYAKQREDAAAIAFVVLAEQGQVDDATAGEQALLFAEWALGVSYFRGQLRRHGGLLYRCVQDHTSQEGWEPDKTAALWALAHDPAEKWPAWSPPLGAHDAYSAGAQVSHQDGRWTSDLDGNVWEPGVYGWSRMEEIVDGA